MGQIAKSHAAYERALTLQPNTITAWQGVVELYKGTTEWTILKRHLSELIPKFITYVRTVKFLMTYCVVSAIQSTRNIVCCWAKYISP
jgi:hypothetical protein